MRRAAVLLAATCVPAACVLSSCFGKEKKKAEARRRKAAADQLRKTREKFERARAEALEKKKQTEAKKRKMALEALRRTATISPPKVVEKKDPAKIIANCAKAKGGVKALRAVKTVRVKQKLRGAAALETESFFKAPLTMRVDYYMGGQLAKSLITDGHKGTVLTTTSVRKMEEVMVDDLRNSARADSINLLIRALKPGAKLTYLGETRVAGKKADAVKIELKDLSVTVYVATGSHDFVAAHRKTSRGMVTLLHADFREVKGLKLAHKTIIRIGSSVYVATVKEMVINPKLNPDVFDPTKHPLNK
jgi:hypothetical protein